MDEHNASTQLALPSAVLHRGKEYIIYSKLPNLLITGGTKEMETRDYALLKTPSILEPSTASFVSDGTNWRNISVNNHNQSGWHTYLWRLPQRFKLIHSIGYF